ncbi:hypothetical protein ACK8GE_21445 [Micromonosporaceae bacterium DT194]|uniref:phasin family protein n=1 Tax=Melissospora conviva TaxID=3388432 RepID=UPI003C27853A
MQDAWRTYLELAVGMTDETRRKVQTVAQKLAGSSGATAAQVQAFAEELVSTGLANREALTKIVRFEVDRALGAVGLATAEEVADLTARVRQLEGELRRSRAGRGAEVSPEEAGAFLAAAADADAAHAGTAGAGASPAAGRAAPQKTMAKKTVAKKARPAGPVAKKAVAKAQPDSAVAKKTPPGKVVAKKTVAKKAIAKAQPDSTASPQPQPQPQSQPGTGKPVKKMAKKTVRPAANRQSEQR